MTKHRLGLREAKKRITRRTIADAALRLTLEKGLSGVTIDEIAREAFVSARTVSNYFSCKEEAVVAAGAEPSVDIAEEFSQRPADEPPLHALSVVLTDYVRSLRPEQLRLSGLKMELEDANPTLRPFRVAQYAELEEALLTRVADRTGTDADSDLYPRLVAAAAVSAASAAMRLWIGAQAPPADLPGMIQDAFDQLSAGLPVPGVGSPGAEPGPHTDAVTDDDADTQVV